MTDDKPMTWKVEDGGFVLPGGSLMTGTCHHKKSGACGGCYARLMMALDEAMKADDAKALIREVQAALIAEWRATKAGGVGTS